jgi:hypothetical protein
VRAPTKSALTMVVMIVVCTDICPASVHPARSAGTKPQLDMALQRFARHQCGAAVLADPSAEPRLVSVNADAVPQPSAAPAFAAHGLRSSAWRIRYCQPKMKRIVSCSR